MSLGRSFLFSSSSFQFLLLSLFLKVHVSIFGTLSLHSDLTEHFYCGPIVGRRVSPSTSQWEGPFLIFRTVILGFFVEGSSALRVREMVLVTSWVISCPLLCLNGVSTFFLIGGLFQNECDR